MSDGPSDFGVVTEAHGIMGSVAWVIFFPLGAIILRLMKGRNTIWVHAAIQAFALILFTANFGQGVWMVLKGGFDFADYHPAIGVVLFSFVWTQPVSGLLHHTLYKKKGGRTIISHIHIWLGRCLITIGMIQGGLGILYAGGEDASRGEIIAYGVIAALIWLAYVGVIVYDFATKRDAAPEAKDFESKETSHTASGEASVADLNTPSHQ